MIKRVFLTAAALAFSQPAAAATVFQSASLFFFTYAEAGGTGLDGQYQGNSQDLTGQAGSATLPTTPLRDEQTAVASFAKAGTTLAQATASGVSSADFASVDEVSFTQSGSYDVAVTGSGAADPRVFAGASPMYYSSFFYDFTVDTTTLMSFSYSSDADYQGSFSLSGTNSYSAFLTGTGAFSQVLGPGSYALEIFARNQVGDSLEGVGTRTGSFSSAYKFTLAPTNAAVPETATWLMMIAGIGMVGATLRRRSPRPELGTPELGARA